MKHKFILGLAASLVVTASHATLFQQAPSVASDVKVTGLPDFSKLMQSEGSKVVHINLIQKSSSDAQNPMNELLRRFFQQGQGSKMMKKRSRKSLPRRHRVHQVSALDSLFPKKVTF